MGGFFEQVGGIVACESLSCRFHEKVAQDDLLRPMFPKELTATTSHLALFLAEALGGPKTYRMTRGKQSLICRHAHLPIGPAAGERWLTLMSESMDEEAIVDPARTWLTEFFQATIPTLSDPFLGFY